MERKKSLLWAIVFSAASTVAVAGGDKSSKTDAASDDAASASSASMTSFSEVDKDGNGMLDKDEAANAADLDFLYTDLNQDGSVSRAEYEVVVRQQQDIADGATGDSSELSAAEGEAAEGESETDTGAAESSDTTEPESEASTDAEAPADAEADVEAESSPDAEEAPTETESSQ